MYFTFPLASQLLPFKFVVTDWGNETAGNTLVKDWRNITGLDVVVKDCGKVIGLEEVKDWGKVVGPEAVVKDSDVLNCPAAESLRTVVKTVLFASLLLDVCVTKVESEIVLVWYFCELVTEIKWLEKYRSCFFFQWLPLTLRRY